ncbi:MAG: 2-oxo-4-hydroxy-4-carboxy-5-ureidoimidazoline decarboxylase, partial [Bradymonadaceae bacterium]
RSREDDHCDWVVVGLADQGTIERLEIDTEHFKGNYPGSCSVEGARHDGADASVAEADWRTVLPETDLQAHTRHVFEDEIADTGPFTHLRLNIFPDGGIARFRAHGRLDETGWAARKLRQLNTFPARRAREAFLACCGADRWADAMVEGRTYDNPEELLEAADVVFDDLSTDDWLEAFAAHPRIGQEADEGDQTEQGESWSEDEQSGTEEMATDTETRLRELNRKYYDKFGFIYIVYSSGKSADEMLGLLEDRLDNDRETELRNAAEAQRQITQSRLQKLLTP